MRSLGRVLLGFYIYTASRETSGNDLVIVHSHLFLIVTNRDDDDDDDDDDNNNNNNNNNNS